MSTMASRITGIWIVYSTLCSGADQRKHLSSDAASLAFVRGIHRSSVNSQEIGPVTRKMFPFDDVIMSLCKCGFLCMLLPHPNTWWRWQFESLNYGGNLNFHFKELGIIQITSLWLRIWHWLMKNESRHDANFVAPVVVVTDNVQSYQCRQSWHHDNARFLSGHAQAYHMGTKSQEKPFALVMDCVEKLPVKQ